LQIWCRGWKLFDIRLRVWSKTVLETKQFKPEKHRSGRKSPAATLSGQSEEATDFEPKPFFGCSTVKYLSYEISIDIS
jgi:hypothetical protein